MFGELMAVAFALPITVEDKNKKDSIYRYITNNPGCNLSDIIKKLEMEDKIVLKKMSKYKKYYLKAETRSIIKKYLEGMLLEPALFLCQAGVE